jgi:hypothetical protein
MFVRKALLFLGIALGLSGCFDLNQSVWLNRDGSGHYDMTIAAGGTFGEALRKGKSDMHVGHNPRLPTHTKTVIQGGKTVQTTTVDFKQLSDLSLSNESVAVKVHGRDLFGLGQTHAVFRRTFFVNSEMKKRQPGTSDDDSGRAIIASLFGDHVYVFSVHLPGSLDWIAPVSVGGVQVKPDIHEDSTGRTITWSMPLTSLIEARAMHFSVGFSSYGALADSETMRDDNPKD